ncbi:biotin transporter BioY [Streptomyces tsukubensis]|uniref:Biotin transporter n=1 Tax=Streptomyces tsukubensis TaxID=83656 RepID=A0A1V4AGT5_9ACTN|nr:biotin transporter BioY [Streptomyces tsukubensis]OON82907.1 BioY family transporter [Streptomyces tsukubensis]QFR91907.1 BioY family transporter [Streptomyces tsukubensis]
MSVRNRRPMGTRDIVLIALFGAIIVALGLIPPVNIAIVPVPITLQTLGVMLAGAILGPIRGACACALVVLLTALGLPVLAGGRGGLGVFPGPTGGYLVGWIPGAFVTGFLVKTFAMRVKGRVPQLGAYFVSCVVGGLLVVYALGVPWTSVSTGLSMRKALVGALYFAVGDTLKAVVTAAIAYNVRRSYPIEPR